LASIPTIYKGKPLSIGFNARYLIDVLGVLGRDGEIDIELKDEVSPSVIRKAGVDSYARTWCNAADGTERTSIRVTATDLEVGVRRTSRFN
jgi:hypothetical protein